MNQVKSLQTKGQVLYQQHNNSVNHAEVDVANLTCYDSLADK